MTSDKTTMIYGIKNGRVNCIGKSSNRKLEWHLLIFTIVHFVISLWLLEEIVMFSSYKFDMHALFNFIQIDL